MKNTIKRMSLLFLVALGGCVVAAGPYPSGYYGYNYPYYYDYGYPYYAYPPYFGSSLYFGSFGWDGHDGFGRGDRGHGWDHRGGEPSRGPGGTGRSGRD